MGKAEYKNRSSLRSKRMIREAFLTMLPRKPFEKITVADIVRESDLNRSTFYAHYPDVHGVAEEIENEILQEMYRILEHFDYKDFFEDPRPILEQTLSYMDEQSDYFRALLQSTNADAFLHRLCYLFEQRMESVPNVPPALRSRSSYAIRVACFSGGIAHILKEWLEGTLPCSAEDITRELCYLFEGKG